MNDQADGDGARGGQESSVAPEAGVGASESKKVSGGSENRENRESKEGKEGKEGKESKESRSAEGERGLSEEKNKGGAESSKTGGKEDKAPPADPDRQNRSATTERWSASTERMFGAGYNTGTINVNMGRESGAVSASFEQHLKVIRVPAVPKTTADAADVSRADAADVTRYVTLLRERRVLVIAHARRGEEEAVSAMRSLLRSVRESEPTRSQATSGFDGTFPLHSFYASAEWPRAFCGSLIYLNRSADMASASFFENDDKVILLRNQLEEVDAHLLVTVNAENRRFMQGTAEVDTWRLAGSTEPGESTDWSSTYSSPLETAIAVCAALLPGLGVREFVEVVDSLVSAPTTTPQSAAPLAPGPKGGHPQVAGTKAQTRDKRWSAGERDAVLRELGVVFSTPEERSSESSLEAGFIFGDANQRAAMPGWVLSHFPVLITGHIDRLADRYLTHSSTKRFRINFLNLLFQLEGFGLFRLSAPWLERQFQSLFGRERALECSRYFVDLLVKAMDSLDGNTLVDEVVKGIAADAIHRERSFLEAVPEELFATALRAATPDDQDSHEAHDPTGRFWEVLVNAEASRILTQSVILRLHLAIETLAELSRHRPAAVLAGVQEILASNALDETRWSRQVMELETTAPILRISYLAFRAILERIVEKDPSLWIAFSQMMLGEDGGRDGPAKSDVASGHQGRSSFREPQTDEDESPAAVALTSDCLNVLAKHLSGIEPKALPDSLYEALFSEDRRARTGRLLAGLIAKYADIDEGSVVWFYRVLTTTLLARKTAVAGEVSLALYELMAPLRSELSASRRSGISRRAHDYQRHYFERRDYFLAVGARELLRAERDRIQAMHIVIRALSGVRPAAAPTSK